MTKADSKTSWTYWPMLRDVKSMGLRYRNPQRFELLFEPHLTRATIAGAFHPSFDWRWWCSSCCVIWCHGPSLSSRRFGPSDTRMYLNIFELSKHTRRWWDPEMLDNLTIIYHPIGLPNDLTHTCRWKKHQHASHCSDDCSRMHLRTQLRTIATISQEIFRCMLQHFPFKTGLAGYALIKSIKTSIVAACRCAFS